MTNQSRSGKTYCNCLAQERGLDPMGHAGSFDDAIVVEVPLPWRLDMTTTVGVLPQEIIDLMALWLQRYQAGEGYPHLAMVVAPDPEYSREGYRRVIHYQRPEGLFAQFEKVEYWLPEEQVGELVWALYEDREALPNFEQYHLSEASSVRDILICTHGTVDAACAKFGYPLYQHMRETYSSEQLRIWRVSHFGGHVFAPTLMDMPIGHYWAYVGTEQAEQIIKREGDVSALRNFYRGWAGMKDGYQQSAETALWQQFGWEWFDYLKSATVHEKSDASGAEVRLHYIATLDSEEISTKIAVTETHSIETPHSTNNATAYPYAQYAVSPGK